MTLHTKIYKNLIDILVNFSCRMVLEWREREHGDIEEAVRADRMAQEALRRCGLYKFWCLGGLRAKPALLQMLVESPILLRREIPMAWGTTTDS